MPLDGVKGRRRTERKVQSGCAAASLVRAGWKRRQATHQGTKKSATMSPSPATASRKASGVATRWKLLGRGSSNLLDVLHGAVIR